MEGVGWLLTAFSSTCLRLSYFHFYNHGEIVLISNRPCERSMRHFFILPVISCNHIRREQSTGGSEVYHQDLLTFIIDTEKACKMLIWFGVSLNLTMSLLQCTPSMEKLLRFYILVPFHSLTKIPFQPNTLGWYLRCTCTYIYAYDKNICENLKNINSWISSESIGIRQSGT